MTVCAAAIFTVETTLAGSKRAVVGISDRMVTAGDVEYEPKNHTKIYAFSIKPGTATKIIALGSGDSSSHYSLSRMTHQEMERLETTEVENA